MWTALFLVTLALSGLIQVKADDDPRLEAELACLDRNPADLCDLEVTYKSLGQLACNQVVPSEKESILLDKPSLKVTPVNSPVTVALVMFDPDAPVSSDPSLGFLHWLAVATVSVSGDVVVGTVSQEYFQPSPPRGSYPHRYQFFLFQLPADHSGGVTGGESRMFSLCSFVNDNNLKDKLLASFQFQFQRQ